jgi:hypothetical protein
MKSKKRATSQEFADYFGVSRETIGVWKKDFNSAYKKHPYNAKNINSVWDFFVYVLKEKSASMPFITSKEEVDKRL